MSDILPRDQAFGNGVQTVFTYTFRILADADIAVFINEARSTLNTEYTVQGAGNVEGGTVTFVTAPGNDVVVTLLRDQDHVRTVTYAEAGPFFAATVNRDFDRRVMSEQQLQEQADRSIRLGPGAEYDGELLEIEANTADRLNKVLGFDGDGDLTLRGDLATEQFVLDTISVTGNGTVRSVTGSGGTTGLTLTGGPITNTGTLTLGGTLAVASGGTGVTTSTGTGSVVLSASPALTGTPTVPTQTAGDNSTRAASTAFVTTAVASAAYTTGDIKITWKTTADTGWIMHTDGSIGAASSGATYANAAAQALYLLIWTNFSNSLAPVNGGRGANAAADWAANKRIDLPKALGRAIGVAGAGSGLTSRTLGSTVGAETAIASTTLPVSGTALGYGSDNSFVRSGAYDSNAFSIMSPTAYFNVMIKL